MNQFSEQPLYIRVFNCTEDKFYRMIEVFTEGEFGTYIG